MAKPGPDKEVPDEEILLRFVMEPSPVLIASELADQYPISRQTAANYLNDLEDDGFLKSKTAGGRRLYWITYKGRKRVFETYVDEVFD